MAEYTCQDVLKIMPDNTEVKIELARCYISRNLFKKALSLLKTSKQTNLSPNPEIHNLRGYCYLELKNCILAGQEFEIATILNPNIPLFHYNLAITYFHLGEYAKVKDECRKVLQLEPNHGQAEAMLRFCKIKRGSKICG